jgi:hypothetical protein
VKLLFTTISALDQDETELDIALKSCPDDLVAASFLHEISVVNARIVRMKNFS